MQTPCWGALGRLPLGSPGRLPPQEAGCQGAGNGEGRPPLLSLFPQLCVQLPCSSLPLCRHRSQRLAQH
eukprot:2878991-Pyramimonas_sp.AAC.1